MSDLLANDTPSRHTREMIVPPKISSELAARWSEFNEFELARQDEAAESTRALERLADLSAAEILTLIGSQPTPGAIPTAEVDLYKGLRVPFSPEFAHHAAAREWAASVLGDNVIVAVDGSQIPPPTDPYLPVAAVQAAWFENHHTSDGRYERQLEFELLSPRDLQKSATERDEVQIEQIINLRRFELELRTLERRLAALSSARRDGRLPIGLIDSSLVISFAERLPDELRQRYSDAVLALLRSSERTGIPVIGYVDGSRSRDLLHLLKHAFGLTGVQGVDDGQLLSSHLTWGERTPLMVCARGSSNQREAGILESLDIYRRGIGFVYLKTGAATPPARLEIPLWVWNEGLLDQVIDLIRAEVIVGNGYPYALQSADAAVAISSRDRDHFYAIVSRFAAQHGHGHWASAKIVSKTRRR